MSADWINASGMTPTGKERLSALADGELHADEVTTVLRVWRDDRHAQASVCETWHAYQLIGDVMRSDDLARRGRDDVFLDQLRQRLAQEPVVIAPAPDMAHVHDVDAQVDEAAARVANGVPHALVGGARSTPNMAAAARRRGWTAPLAAAAGVMVVAGVLVVTRMAQDPGVGGGGGAAVPAQLVQAPAGVEAPQAFAQPPVDVAAEQRVVTANGTLVRDARLDQYLSAHKQFGGSSALGVPAGFLRSATYEGPSR